MEILIKAEEMNEEELRAQFNVIKLAAYNRKPLPEDFEPDSIDLDYAEKVMKKIGCPVINVSDKAIEETASDILDIMKEKGIHKRTHKDA